MQKVNRPKNSPILQQKLKAFQPIYTLETTIGLLVFCSVLFSVFGIVLYSEASRLSEYSYSYTNCKSEICTKTINIPEMQPPIYVYYELRNFYQNHREYMKSRSYKQLMGQDLSYDEISDCKGVRKGKSLYEDYYLDGSPILDDDVANPCGLVARSIFNDTMVLTNAKGEEVQISTEGIAWKSDKSVLFKHPKNYTEKTWIDTEDERFIVWMRTALTKNFRKMWGVISRNDPLPAGDYTFTINNSYNVKEWHGRKKFVISNANALGGKNYFLGMIFLLTGLLCLFVSLFFCGRAMISKKGSISVDQLSW